MRLKFKFSSDQFVVILLLIISSCGTDESNSKIEQKYLIGELPVQEGMVYSIKIVQVAIILILQKLGLI